MTTPAVVPAIPLDSRRNLALSGLVLAAILVIRSPMLPLGPWSWWILMAALALRLAFGDRVRWRWARGGRGSWVWRLLLITYGLRLLFGDKSAEIYILLPIIISLASAPPGGAPLHRLHVATWSAAGLLYVELGLIRGVLHADTWLSFGGDPWQGLLLWFGLVVLLTGVIDWIQRTIHLRRNLRAARDQALRLKLAPHFIFNTLNALKAQLERDPREAGATVDRLAALYRQLLERTDRPTVPLREELAFVEAYLGIEQVRLGGRLRVKIHVPEAAESRQIPTLALQTLVENAVKHGIAPRETGGEIVIRVTPWALTGLRVSVENPVLAGGPALAANGTGTGLETLRARLLRPTALNTEVRDGRFLASFIWEPQGSAPEAVA